MAKTTFVDVFLRIRNSNIFNASVVSVIIASALYAGVTSYNIPDDYQFILNVFDYGITIFFVIEIIIRLISEKSLLNFFKSGWNIFDFVIITKLFYNKHYYSWILTFDTISSCSKDYYRKA